MELVAEQVRDDDVEEADEDEQEEGPVDENCGETGNEFVGMEIVFLDAVVVATVAVAVAVVKGGGGGRQIAVALRVLFLEQRQIKSGKAGNE